MNKITLSGILLVVAVMLLGATYKWVDEEGHVHYSDQPTDGYKTKEVEIESGPSKKEVREAREIAERQQQRSRDQQEQHQPSAVSSLPLAELGPLPENKVSEYAETVSTGIYFNTEKLIAQFSITLKAKYILPPGSYFEVYFPNPANPINPFVVGKVRKGNASEVFISSPELTGLKCWNYEIVTYIYRGSSKSELLGTHSQFVQSRVNMDKAKDGVELVTALVEDNCP
jgi:hypothetical protein